MKNIKKVITICSAVTLIFSAGCSDKRNVTENGIVYYDGSSNEYVQQTEGMENGDGQVVPQDELIENIPTQQIQQGVKSEVSGLDVTLTDIFDVGEIKAEQVNYDRQVIAFVFEITNNTDSDIDVNAFDVKVEYMDGERNTVTTGVEAMLKAEDKIKDMESLNATLKPGETVKGYAAIGVYSVWETMTVYFTPQVTGQKDALAFDITKDAVKEL